MKIPTFQETYAILCEAQKQNPGPWIQHAIFTAQAARVIATHHPELDPTNAYILGHLHDIGRQAGESDMRHIFDGYNFLLEKGYEDAARICLTHSFPIKNVNAIAGQWDCTDQELHFLEDYLAKIEYTPYDQLLQLADAVAVPNGFCLMEQRFVDVTIRHGFNEYTIPRWQAYTNIRREFESVIGLSIYSILPGVIENTFGFDRHPALMEQARSLVQ